MQLDLKTFSEAMYASGYEGSEAKVRLIFNKFDRDDSGVIEKNEIVGLLSVFEKLRHEDCTKELTDHELVAEATLFADTWEILSLCQRIHTKLEEHTCRLLALQRRVSGDSTG